MLILEIQWIKFVTGLKEIINDECTLRCWIFLKTFSKGILAPNLLFCAGSKNPTNKTIKTDKRLGFLNNNLIIFNPTKSCWKLFF